MTDDYTGQQMLFIIGWVFFLNQIQEKHLFIGIFVLILNLPLFFSNTPGCNKKKKKNKKTICHIVTYLVIFMN